MCSSSSKAEPYRFRLGVSRLCRVPARPPARIPRGYRRGFPAPHSRGCFELVNPELTKERWSTYSWTGRGARAPPGPTSAVTKQAAQKRFVPPGTRAGARSRCHRGLLSVHPAGAQRRDGGPERGPRGGHDQIRPEHLVLGLLADPQSLAATAICSPWSWRTAEASCPGSASTSRGASPRGRRPGRHSGCSPAAVTGRYGPAGYRKIVFDTSSGCGSEP
jgi:hypothetical protein